MLHGLRCSSAVASYIFGSIQISPFLQAYFGTAHSSPKAIEALPFSPLGVSSRWELFLRLQCHRCCCWVGRYLWSLDGKDHAWYDWAWVVASSVGLLQAEDITLKIAELKYTNLNFGKNLKIFSVNAPIFGSLFYRIVEKASFSTILLIYSPGPYFIKVKINLIFYLIKEFMKHSCLNFFYEIVNKISIKVKRSWNLKNSPRLKEDQFFLNPDFKKILTFMK